MVVIDKADIKAGDYFINVVDGGLMYCYYTLPVPRTPYRLSLAREEFRYFLGSTIPDVEEALCNEQLNFEETLTALDIDAVPYCKALLDIDVYSDQAVITALGANQVIRIKSDGY